MLRSALVAALAVAFPTFADEDEPMRTEPLPTFAAEAQQVKLTVVPADGFDWAEITFRVTRCIAGPCHTHESVKVLTPLATWRGQHGQTMGVVKYDWKDKQGGPRQWATALRFDHADENDRWIRDSDWAESNAGASADDSAVATR